MNEDLSPIISRALEWGILDIKVIPASDIAVAEWVALKCRYGCPSYGQNLDCPPAAPGPEVMRRLVTEYNRAMVVKLRRLPEYDATQSGLVHRLERELLFGGFFQGFALSAGSCGECPDECDRAPGKCPKPHNIRPSTESLGVNWIATLRNAGWEMAMTADRNELPPSYSLVLVD